MSKEDNLHWEKFRYFVLMKPKECFTMYDLKATDEEIDSALYGLFAERNFRQLKGFAKMRRIILQMKKKIINKGSLRIAKGSGILLVK